MPPRGSKGVRRSPRLGRGQRLTEKRFWGRLEALQRTAELQGAKFADDTPERRLERRARAVVLPEYFNAVYLGHYFKLPPAAFHLELYRALEHHRRVVARAPRGHAKSTVVTFAYVLHQVVCGEVLRAWHEGTLEASDPELHAAILDVIDDVDGARLRDWQAAAAKLPAGAVRPEVRPPVQLHYDPYIQVVGCTKSDGEEFTGAIKLDLEENPLLRYDWGELVEDPGVNYGDFVARTGVRVRAFGMDGSIRGGKHRADRPTLAVLDDVDDDFRTVSNLKVRDRRTKKITAAISYGLDPQRGRVMLLGTPTHFDGQVCRFADPERFRRWHKLRFRAITDDNKPLWPEKWSLDALREEEDEDPEAFAAEMMDTPPNDGQRIFHTLHHYSRAEYEGRKLPKVLAFDPALGRSEKSDLQAVVVLRYDRRTRKVLVHRAEGLRISDELKLVGTVNAIRDEEQPDAAVMETIGFQAMLKVLMELVDELQGILSDWIKIDRQEEGKELRFRGMAGGVNTGRFVFPDDGSCRQLERQLLSYGEGGKVDLIDAMEMAYRELKVIIAGKGAREVHHGRARRGFGRAVRGALEDAAERGREAWRRAWVS